MNRVVQERSILETKTMPIYQTGAYQVKPSAVGKAKQAIQEIVYAVIPAAALAHPVQQKCRRMG